MKSKHGILCKDWNHVIEKDTLVLPFQSQLERNWIRLKSYCKPDAISNGIPIGTKNLPINCESAWDNQYQTMEKCYFNFLNISYLINLICKWSSPKSKTHPKMMKIGKFFHWRAVCLHWDISQLIFLRKPLIAFSYSIFTDYKHYLEKWETINTIRCDHFFIKQKDRKQPRAKKLCLSTHPKLVNKKQGLKCSVVTILLSQRKWRWRNGIAIQLNRHFWYK